MQLSITCPTPPITGWGGEIGEGMSLFNFAGCLCPTIGDFELCLVTSKLLNSFIQIGIVLRDIPRGGVFGFSYFLIWDLLSPTPSHNGGSGAYN